MSAARFLNWTRASRVAANGITMAIAGKSVPVSISALGPGDACGINADQIRFREPAPEAVGFPPNLFPFVEFTQPDLPWQLTPGAPDAQGRLTPWLALIVIEAPSGTPLGRAGSGNLPVLTAKADDLPPADEIALWAHTQIASDGVLSDDIVSRGFSRVISPRALSPLTRYIACLVPTFEAGRLAGLGQDLPDRLSATMAWKNATGSIELPVYDSWFFTTAASGDFETLARKLKGRDISQGSRALNLNVSSVASPNAIATFEGGLVPQNANEDWSGTDAAAAATLLGDWMKRETTSPSPVIGPSVYGSIQTAQWETAQGWMADLNFDPRRRAAAGLGAEIVREHQDELVDEAWRQAGDLERARREHAGALLAETIHLRLHAKFVAPLAEAHALVALSPALSLLRDAAAPSGMAPVTAARLASSPMPAATLTAPFRRLLNTKMPRAAKSSGASIVKTLPTINALSITPGIAPPNPAGIFTKQLIGAALNPAVHLDTTDISSAVSRAVVAGVIPPVSTLSHTIDPGPIDQPPVHTHPLPPIVHTHFGTVLKLNLTQLQELRIADAAWQTRKPQAVSVQPLKQFAWLKPPAPSLTGISRFVSRLDLVNTARMRNGGAGIAATPHFPQTLCSWLDPAYLLAGVHIPPDTAGLLNVNAPFIEALLIGANHELARELLWRGVPLDRSATLLTRFFDTSPGGSPNDMPPISGWHSTDALGSHESVGSSSVLILRSRLVSRLSEALIYIAHADADGPYRKPGAQQILPSFQGPAGLDTAFFGFSIPTSQLAGSATDLGWYLVIQEREGASKFGLDEGAPAQLATWDDLAWPLVTTAHGYLSVAGSNSTPSNPGALHWGVDSAQMAAILLQKPIRISIHASTLVATG
jgi:hypothetical protein